MKEQPNQKPNNHALIVNKAQHVAKTPMERIRKVYETKEKKVVVASQSAEELAVKSARLAFIHARDIVGGRFKEGENIIATDAGWSCQYARNILKGRFEIGEKAIASDAKWSYFYALDVLRGRFEMGEDAISRDKYWGYKYACDVLKGHFDAEGGEAEVAFDDSVPAEDVA